MNRFTPLLLAIGLLVGCSEDGRTAEGAQLLVPDAVQVQWDDRLNAQSDGLGILVPIDLMVYEGSTGEPLNLVQVDVHADAGAVVLPMDSVETQSADCTNCVWDSGRDRYVVLPVADPNGQPLLTDPDGLARVYVWIDVFPADDDATLLPIEVDVDTEVSGSTFEIHGT